jgi:hypothetical protein
LRNILRFRSVPHEPVTHVEYPARMAAHKFLPGRAIALEALLDQMGILLQAVSAPYSRDLPRLYPLQGSSACQIVERKMHPKCSLSERPPDFVSAASYLPPDPVTRHWNCSAYAA